MTTEKTQAEIDFELLSVYRELFERDQELKRSWQTEAYWKQKCRQKDFVIEKLKINNDILSDQNSDQENERLNRRIHQLTNELEATKHSFKPKKYKCVLAIYQNLVEGQIYSGFECMGVTIIKITDDEPYIIQKRNLDNTKDYSQFVEV
jgi:hypothetical protein